MADLRIVRFGVDAVEVGTQIFQASNQTLHSTVA
jgi:hypothetical protein